MAIPSPNFCLSITTIQLTKQYNAQTSKVLISPKESFYGYDVIHCRYTRASIVIYFEDCDNNLVQVEESSSLCQALTHHKFILKAGTPGFIILVNGSKVHTDFLQKYTVVK